MNKMLASMTSTALALAFSCATSAVGESFPPGPPATGGPVVVRAGFDLRDINYIDEEAETFQFEGVLTLSWHDARLSFDPADVGADEKIYQGAYQFNEVFGGWFPQVVLVNESETPVSQGVVLRVRSDGSLTLVQMLNATAKTDLDMRRYPFDVQRLSAAFEVLGFDETEVVLQGEASASRGGATMDRMVRLPQWEISQVLASVLERPAPHAGSTGTASTFVVGVDVKRESFFMVRLVILPLILMVMLSWSVFWMERSSLGDRISVSFIGILTAVAYQMMVADTLPDISYITLIHGILNLSFLLMCATVVINLVVGAFDKAGRLETGDKIDRRCRLIFPVAYFGLMLVIVAAAFWLFPDPRFVSEV